MSGRRITGAGVTGVQASAPGKLLLLGEYAVLDGAPALVMAVDRRVNVRIEPARPGCGWLSAPQLGIRKIRMRIDAGRLHCSGLDSDALGLTGRLIPGILRSLGRAPQEIETINIEIDSGALFEFESGQSVKLGLGSSAAVCAALAVGLSAWFGDSADSAQAGKRLDRWLPVYRDALGARASGADLAGAFFGGFSQFRSAGENADCRALTWPGELHWRAIWTRRAAQTTDYVGAFDAWKEKDPAGAAAILARLTGIARRGADNTADSAALLEACRAYCAAMVDLGEAMGREIMTPAHQSLADLGRRRGVVYKSCGAGGGDLGIALARDPERLRAFESGVSELGGVPLNLTISESGAALAPSRPPDTGE